MLTKCNKCKGSGWCSNCRGTGKVEGTGYGAVDKLKRDCAFCGGERFCRICRGAGMFRS
jgi:DnaJ-class molecular chaperone